MRRTRSTNAMRRQSKLSKRSHQTADYEKLESRLLLAGNVRLAANNGSLFITGDAQSNQVEIATSNDGQGNIRVIGIDGTTINGLAEVLIEDNDAVIWNGFRINMGRGDDVLKLNGVAAGGFSTFFGSFGDDVIGFDGVTLGEALIQTFDGDDSVSIDGLIANGDVRIFTLDGSDDVGISNLRSFQDTLIVTGNGNDRVAIKDSAVYQAELRVLTFEGNDYVGFDNISVGFNAGVFTGNGDDGVSIRDTIFHSNGVIAGQAGFDEFNQLGNNSGVQTFTFEGQLAGGISETTQVFNDFIESGIRLGTISELADLNPQLSTLTDALRATGLYDTLDSRRATFTVFAPLNSAFDQLPDGTLDDLSIGELSNILRFHVSEGTVTGDQLATLNLVPTLLNQNFTVEVENGEVVLEGYATVATTDIKAKNGTIHLLENVLIPS